MIFRVIANRTIVLIGILTILSSCIGHSTSVRTDSSLRNQNKAVSIGDTVSEMDKGILVIFQDSKDNYWFGGGESGVYKYDGASLVLYSVKEGLPGNKVLGIQEDKLGNIYFDSSEGVSKFDGQKFTTLEVKDNSASRNKWKLEPDDLWFRMGWDKNGPYRYDGKLLYQLEFPKTDQVDEFYAKYPNASYNPYGIYTLYKDSEGTMWFGTSSLGVCRFDGKTIDWLYERQLTETPSGGAFGIRSIIEDRDGYFWFCNTRYRYDILANNPESTGANHINYRKEKGVRYSNDNSKIDFPYFMSIAEDSNGDLWMATHSDGVWRNDDEKLIHYPIKDGETDVLLFSIYKDNQGTLWLGTHNAGVYKYDGSNFEKFEP